MSSVRTPITAIDVEGLGEPALVVHAKRKKILLLDAALDHDDRMDILQRFFPLGTGEGDVE